MAAARDLVRAPRPEDLFYDAFRASPIGIAIEDLSGLPVFVNPALCSMLGFTEAELLQKHCADFSPPEDGQKDWALFQQLRVGAVDRYSLDKRYFRKDGSLMWGRLSISLLHNQASPLVIAMVEDINDKQRALDELQQSEANLQRLSGRLIEAQEQERRHIAREIHDDISQKLALLTHRVHRLAPADAETERDLDLEPVLADVLEIGRALHALSHRLHSSKLDTLGLVPAMKGFCREFAEQHQLQVDFTHEDIPEHVSRYLSLSLFRVLQEGLSNVAKHSGASHVAVRLEQVSDSLDLTIRDAGRGFDPAVALLGKGIGLMSMRERIHLVKGSFAIRSKPQGGTEIHVRVPIADPADVA
jgi:PAS domain S-box-containing protein